MSPRLRDTKGTDAISQEGANVATTTDDGIKTGPQDSYSRVCGCSQIETHRGFQIQAYERMIALTTEPNPELSILIFTHPRKPTHPCQTRHIGHPAIREQGTRILSLGPHVCRIFIPRIAFPVPTFIQATRMVLFVEPPVTISTQT